MSDHRSQASPLMVDGHTTASHTISIEHLSDLLATVPASSDSAGYVGAIVDDNVLARPTVAGRQRILRHLRELYVLDFAYPPFRALRLLWDEDTAARPLLAGLLAYSRDSVLRASHSAIGEAKPGDVMTSFDLSAAVVAEMPSHYSESTLAKVGRNTASCWTQTGHLIGRTKKVRQLVAGKPASAAYALLLGHLDMRRGALLFDTPWTTLLDAEAEQLREFAAEASRVGYLDWRSAGGVVDVSFPHLLGKRAS